MWYITFSENAYQKPKVLFFISTILSKIQVIIKYKEDVSIRDFKKSDIDNFLEVANKSFTKEFEISGFDSDHIKKLVDKAFSFLGKIFLGSLKLLHKEPFKLFVAEVDGKIVGTTMVIIRCNTGSIMAVMIHPNYRRKGIATKLMKSAINYIQKRKLSRAILQVVSTNTPAKDLYSNLGFKKFESIIYLVAEIDSFWKPRDVEDVIVKNFENGDIEAVYSLIKCSEDPLHLKMFNFSRKDLKNSFFKRVVRFSTDKKKVAIKNNKIVGYSEVSYTTLKEAGFIRNIQVSPRQEGERNRRTVDFCRSRSYQRNWSRQNYCYNFFKKVETYRKNEATRI